jgi:hypothetical protein
METRDVLGALVSHRTVGADVPLAYEPDPDQRDIGMLRQPLDDPVEQAIECSLAGQVEQETANGFHRQREGRGLHPS